MTSPIESNNEAPIQLYEKKRKLYVRETPGLFNRLRWLMVLITQLIYYGTPWLTWDDRQAILFDITARKFYLLGLVLWPHDLFYLTVLLIISAYSLFLFTTVSGRLFCGYACPQTVYTAIFMWIENRIEGDHVARHQLDQSNKRAEKILKRSSKYLLWGLVAAWTGFTFVGYFTPIRALMGQILAGQLSGWETFWIIFYSAFTALFAGGLREQVCKYMCPYARFQSVMFDENTLIVAYDSVRGEPRGKKRNAAQEENTVGDCVDCQLCVQVCPTGIDIRKGLQYECIGCGLCVDACNNIMDRLGRPRRLIRYVSEVVLEQRLNLKAMYARILRPRVLVYSVILWAIIFALAWSLWTRVPIKVEVIRDRGVLSRVDSITGRLENVYRLHVINASDQARTLSVEVTGLPEAELSMRTLNIPRISTRDYPLSINVDPNKIDLGATSIVFVVRDTNAPELTVTRESKFVRFSTN